MHKCIHACTEFVDIAAGLGDSSVESSQICLLRTTFVDRVHCGVLFHFLRNIIQGQSLRLLQLQLLVERLLRRRKKER